MKKNELIFFGFFPAVCVMFNTKQPTFHQNVKALAFSVETPWKRQNVSSLVGNVPLSCTTTDHYDCCLFDFCLFRMPASEDVKYWLDNEGLFSNVLQLVIICSLTPMPTHSIGAMYLLSFACILSFKEFSYARFLHLQAPFRTVESEELPLHNHQKSHKHLQWYLVQRCINLCYLTS